MLVHTRPTGFDTRLPHHNAHFPNRLPRAVTMPAPKQTELNFTMESTCRIRISRFATLDANPKIPMHLKPSATDCQQTGNHRNEIHATFSRLLHWRRPTNTDNGLLTRAR